MPPTTGEGKLASNVNTRGFPALPNELYLEILSYFPQFPIPHNVWLDEKRDRYRQLTLYYLSQTCRSLRSFFLGYAWERIEVFGGMQTPLGHLQDGDGIEDETLRQLETVARNPDLRKYVTTVDIQYTDGLGLPLIARNLSLFPNVHTFKLICESYYTTTTFFSDFRYPTIHTLCLNFRSPIRNVLHACPNTKHFSFHQDRGDWTHFQSVFPGGIEKLGVIMGMGRHLRTLVNYYPRLRDISLCCECMRTSDGTFNLLSSLPLHTIRLRLDDWPRAEGFGYIPRLPRLPATAHERRSWIDFAKQILANCPLNQNETAKRVVVVNDDKTVDIYHLTARF